MVRRMEDAKPRVWLKQIDEIYRAVSGCVVTGGWRRGTWRVQASLYVYRPAIASFVWSTELKGFLSTYPCNAVI
jgi:hypothetical protein